MDPKNLAQTQEPALSAGGISLLRTTLYTLLAGALLTGGWLRFGSSLSTLVPSLAAYGLVRPVSAPAGNVRGLVELGLVSPTLSAQAVASMALPPAEANTLLAAVRRGRFRLIRMPFVDTTPELGDPVAPRIEVSSSGYTTSFILARTPSTIVLPIGPVGQVSVRTDSAKPLTITTIPLSGPMELPNLSEGEQLEIGVIAQ